MQVSLHKASAATFQKHLYALDGILDKAKAYAAAKKIEEETLLSARLFPDMFNFRRQVQEACTFATATMARITGETPAKPANDEISFDDLKARIASDIAVLGACPAEKLAKAAERVISLKVGPNEMTFTGEDYVLHFALPNFYFHCTTAYAILRHNGLEIGKRDFMRRTG